MEQYRPIKRGTVKSSIYVELRDSTTNDVKTGMAFDSAGIVLSYVRGGEARVAITPADLASATAAWASGGFKEVDATNCPGVYRLDLPTAALIASDKADELIVSIKMTGVKSVNYHVPLTDVADVAMAYSGVRVDS